MTSLYKELKKYTGEDYYAFHMPGHKRNEKLTKCDLPYNIDITEIEGFDDLHHARGIIKEAEERASVLYKAEETCYLINGSTVGILSAVMGCTKRGDKILISRNCHKSVYHAIYLNGLKPVYVYPEFIAEMQLNGSVLVTVIEEALKEHNDIKAVVITSPTYDGVVSDIKAIADMVHRKDIPLIVDEAHGAHFGFHKYFPENANMLGADVVIHSLHKTLPSLTQTAFIHMNGYLADRAKIKQYLHMLQTSSPSYVLMASMDVCVELLTDSADKLFTKYVTMLENTREKLKMLKFLKILETQKYDKSKIVISTKDTSITSISLYEQLLKQYHLQMEMAAGSYIIAMTSPGDTQEGFNRLTDALMEIDSQLSVQQHKREYINSSLPRLKQRYTSFELQEKISGPVSLNTVNLLWKDASGKVSAEYVYIYPPGIPFIVPGEVISSEAAALAENYESMGFTIEGLKEEGKVEVLANG
jgi:arginine decarboxylase